MGYEPYAVIRKPDPAMPVYVVNVMVKGMGGRYIGTCCFRWHYIQL